MKANRMQTGIIVVTIFALVGAAGVALAGPWGGHGRGYGTGGGYNQDCPRDQDGDAGWQRGRHMGPGRGFANLTDEQRAQVETLREQFHSETADLRGDIRQRRLTLAAELAKKTPDAAKATEMQKEISNLQAELDVKRLEHRLEMQKVLPEGCAFGPGFGGRGHRGGGSGLAY